MRTVFQLIIFATLFVGPAKVLAQSRTVTEAELIQLVVAAMEKRKGLPQRHKTATSGYAEGDSSETLAEFGPNDSYHYVVIRKSKGAEIRSEGIRIGDVRYTRQKDGSWIKEPPQGKTGGTESGMGSGSGIGTPDAPRETTTEYLYVGKEKVDGQETAHYRKTHIVKFTSRTPVLVRRVVDDYWFGKDGLLVKESKEDAFENSKRRYKSVTVYEYPSNIEIITPIPD